MADSSHEFRSVAPIRRALVGGLSKAIFPQEVEFRSPESLRKATDFVKNGGGLIIGYSHLSGREGADILTWLLRQPVLKSRKIISPVSFHTFNKNIIANLGYKAEALMAGIEFFPMVTPETEGKIDLIAAGAVSSQGFKDYLNAAGRTLSEGGIVPVALQAEGNTGILGEPTPALSAITRAAEKFPESKTAILFVGMELPETSAGNIAMQGANDVAKMHLSRKMTLRIGDFYTLEEAKKASMEDKQPIQVEGKKIRALDSLGFKELASLLSPKNVSPIYLQQK